jgi:hypothetical protein
MSKALQSKAFPCAYLRIDGTGVSAPTSGGGGTVNCQSGVADFEAIEERPQPDGTIALESVTFPNVFLRVDGSGVRSGSDGGVGTVNCQFGAGPWEKFRKRTQSDGTVAFESAAFPGVYLRMDAQSIGEFGSASGGGTVNCQFGVGPWEKFLLLDPPFPSVRWRSEANPVQDVAAKPNAFQASDYDSDYSDLTDANYIYSADFSGETTAAGFDFVATGSVGTSSSLGTSRQLDTEAYSQALAEAGSAESEGTSQDPDQSP